MTKETWVVVWLSIQIAVMSILLVRDARRIGYLEGQQAGLTVTVTETDGGWIPPYPTSSPKPLTNSKRK